ncbi:hypothetical protein [Pectobacterium versatile]|uniref:hypothetical protein n=1 Tax=Pectobacterium versatile TaxID=2488639 RepID=UPI001F1B2C3B|nr:hypothetical protein [Pectobacterium versatile]
MSGQLDSTDTVFLDEDGKKVGGLPGFVPCLFVGMEVILDEGREKFHFIVKRWKFVQSIGLVVTVES